MSVLRRPLGDLYLEVQVQRSSYRPVDTCIANYCCYRVIGLGASTRGESVLVLTL
jgi:hypothetical protein